MSKFRLRLQCAVTITLLALATGCSPNSLVDGAKKRLSRSLNISVTRPVVNSESPKCPQQIDPFTKAINKAMRAATLAQSAQTRQEWDTVASGWIQAIASMQAVPPNNPKRAYAQKKVAEYLKNLDMALQKSSAIAFQLPFASFNNPIFDEQLLLYLSYVAAVGPPDVLIVGSSRALVGIDPRQLQQALAQQGRGNLKIFNFGVNGATAQIVDLQLRQVLSREQLPRLIIWGDGLRAFNSNRGDKTYNSMVASPGYQRLKAGDRPKLPQIPTNTADACDTLPGTSMSSALANPSRTSLDTTNSTSILKHWRLARVSFELTSNSDSFRDRRLLLTQLSGFTEPQRLTVVRNTSGYSSFAIDANGFLPLDNRFDPKTYYQKNPRVPGQYDADYQPLSLSGQQATALNSVKTLAQQQHIPLVVVNLPLTQDYLDSVRQQREQQFQQWMQQQASGGLVFINLGQLWVNQNEYFIDPSHLNRYGAVAVSNQLATNAQIPWPKPRP
ncbi:MAG TPA: hypothetical protein V6C85_01600 [Allocoleopsis sp.]